MRNSYKQCLLPAVRNQGRQIFRSHRLDQPVVVPEGPDRIVQSKAERLEGYEGDLLPVGWCTKTVISLQTSKKSSVLPRRYSKITSFPTYNILNISKSHILYDI